MLFSTSLFSSFTRFRCCYGLNGIIVKVSVKDVHSFSCVNVDAVGGNYIMETRVETLGDVCDGKSNSNLEEAFKLSNCTTHENHPHFKLDNLECNSSITSGGVSSGTPSSVL